MIRSTRDRCRKRWKRRRRRRRSREITDREGSRTCIESRSAAFYTLLSIQRFDFRYKKTKSNFKCEIFLMIFRNERRVIFIELCRKGGL